MALRQTVEATTTHEVQLTRLQQRKLRTELKAYQDLLAERKALDAAIDDHKAAIDRFREQIGEKSLLFEGYRVTLVEGVSTKLDKKRLIGMGVSPAQIEEATVTTPKKPYLKVSLPGEKVYESND